MKLVTCWYLEQVTEKWRQMCGYEVSNMFSLQYVFFQWSNQKGLVIT
jgi:hypothetical protein